MPRQRRGAPARSAPSRPTVTPSRHSGPPQQPPRRDASTSAHPPAISQANGSPAQVGKGPGLFGQMASTAAYALPLFHPERLLATCSQLSSVNSSLISVTFSGVAVGSSVGHAIGGLFGGNSVENQVASDSNSAVDRGNQWGEPNCDTAAKQFGTCMGDNGGNMQICQWYLDQLVGNFRSRVEPNIFTILLITVIKENMSVNGQKLLGTSAIIFG